MVDKKLFNVVDETGRSRVGAVALGNLQQLLRENVPTVFTSSILTNHKKKAF